MELTLHVRKTDNDEQFQLEFIDPNNCLISIFKSALDGKNLTWHYGNAPDITWRYGNAHKILAYVEANIHELIKLPSYPHTETIHIDIEKKVTIDKYVFRNWCVPEQMMEELHAYLNDSIEPDDFLRAILENNFVKAASVADDDQLSNLPAYAALMYNKVSINAWGSKEIVDAWLTRKKE